jgi:hypothetical protein
MFSQQASKIMTGITPEKGVPPLAMPGFLYAKEPSRERSVVPGSKLVLTTGHAQLIAACLDAEPHIVSNLTSSRRCRGPRRGQGEGCTCTAAAMDDGAWGGCYWLVPWSPSLFTLRAAQARTSRRSLGRDTTRYPSLVGLAMHAPERRQAQRNLGSRALG